MVSVFVLLLWLFWFHLLHELCFYVAVLLYNSGYMLRNRQCIIALTLLISYWHICQVLSHPLEVYIVITVMTVI